MTDERKNEIWAMLLQEEKEDFQGMYKLKGSNFDMGYNAALDEIFGEHNLTAQADAMCKENADSFTDSAECVKESSNSFQNSTDWNKYRLYLARKIAVAMIKSHNEPVLRSIAEVAVDTANEIVKRLKETDNAD